MRWRRESRRASLLYLFAGLAVGLVAPGSSGADPAQQASVLRSRQDTLAARSHTALLSLYSLDSELAQARSRLATLKTQAETLRAEQAQARREQTIAQDAWHVSVTALANQLRAMYEQGQPDAIAIVLGASSVDEAMTRLDALERTARVDRQTVEQVLGAERYLAHLRTELRLREERVSALELQAEQTAAALTQRRAQRVQLISSLTRQRAFGARQIKQLETAANQISARSRSVTGPPQLISSGASAPSPGPPPLAPSGGRQLTVSATGYALGGTTATGMPVGWGVVAVDPSVIPLGTRMSIPGYGEGVAADTGSAVHGATIDLWFPTLAQALSWGRRTVTITLH